MKLLPPPGPDRRRLVLMIGVLVVGAALYATFGGGPKLRIEQTLGPPPTSNILVGRGRATSNRPVAPTVPLPLKLAAIDYVPDEPEAGRNLFRFGVKPLPPPPPAPPPPVYTPPVYTPPAPPPIPPIPLKLVTILEDEDGRRRAFLVDPKGNAFEHFEGDIVDGRYKLLKVGQRDVVMMYIDGTGQRVIQQGGG